MTAIHALIAEDQTITALTEVQCSAYGYQFWGFLWGKHLANRTDRWSNLAFSEKATVISFQLSALSFKSTRTAASHVLGLSPVTF